MDPPYQAEMHVGHGTSGDVAKQAEMHDESGDIPDQVETHVQVHVEQGTSEEVLSGVEQNEPKEKSRSNKMLNSEKIKSSMERMENMDVNEVEKMKTDMFKGEKFAEMLEKFKKDRSIVPKTIEMINKNQQIKRNADNMRRNMQGNMTMGQDVPLAQRKKMAKKQEAIKQMAKHIHKEGEVQSVYFYKTGKVNSVAIDIKSLDDGKWKMQIVVINGNCFAAIANTNAGEKNQKASALIGSQVRGPIMFIKLDDNIEPENMSVAEFKEFIQ